MRHLCAAFLLAGRRLSDDWRGHTVRCMSPLNLRRFCPGVAEDIGLFIDRGLDGSSSRGRTIRLVCCALDKRATSEIRKHRIHCSVGIKVAKNGGSTA